MVQQRLYITTWSAEALSPVPTRSLNDEEFHNLKFHIMIGKLCITLDLLIRKLIKAIYQLF